jgi:glutathione S-transferase
MKLFYAETLNPRKACAVAKYLNAPVEFVHVDLRKGENRTPAFLAINPNAKVPVLETGGGSLWESNAIMCYLAVRRGLRSVARWRPADRSDALAELGLAAFHAPRGITLFRAHRQAGVRDGQP